MYYNRPTVKRMEEKESEKKASLPASRKKGPFVHATAVLHKSYRFKGWETMVLRKTLSVYNYPQPPGRHFSEDSTSLPAGGGETKNKRFPF